MERVCLRGSPSPSRRLEHRHVHMHAPPSALAGLISSVQCPARSQWGSWAPASRGLALSCCAHVSLVGGEQHSNCLTAKY
jgi:hypothetical protein